MPNKENFQKWIDALRSGKYKESIRAIEMRSVNGTWDPLGVCCSVSGVGVWELQGVDWLYVIKEGKNSTSYCWHFPIPVANWLEIYPQSYWQQVQVNHETLGSQTVCSLFLNHKFNFKEIADVLEQNFINEGDN